jgi:hypothetical protein
LKSLQRGHERGSRRGWETLPLVEIPQLSLGSGGGSGVLSVSLRGDEHGIAQLALELRLLAPQLSKATLCQTPVLAHVLEKALRVAEGLHKVLGILPPRDFV